MRMKGLALTLSKAAAAKLQSHLSSNFRGCQIQWWCFQSHKTKYWLGREDVEKSKEIILLMSPSNKITFIRDVSVAHKTAEQLCNCTQRTVLEWSHINFMQKLHTTLTDILLHFPLAKLKNSFHLIVALRLLTNLQHLLQLQMADKPKRYVKNRLL